MIRHLHPTDAPALLQFKQRSGPDEVFTLPRALKGGNNVFPLMKYTTFALSPRAWQSCWVKTRRASVQAVLRAGPRSGPLAWELSEMFLPKKSRDVAGEVLEQLAFQAGASGARRIIIRIPSNSELFDAARSAGYQPAFSEVLYAAESARTVQTRTDESSDGIQLRPLDDKDQHALFRLYCATVPIDARTKTGQTLEEWSSSKESPGRKTRNWGVDDVTSGGLQAYVATCRVSAGHYFSVHRRNDATCSTESLIAAGLGQAGDGAVVTMVPNYDQNMSESLTEFGFTSRESYDVMVKTLAVTAAARVPGLVAVE